MYLSFPGNETSGCSWSTDENFQSFAWQIILVSKMIYTMSWTMQMSICHVFVDGDLGK
jgi:hypothetical protein